MSFLRGRRLNQILVLVGVLAAGVVIGWFALGRRPKNSAPELAAPRVVAVAVADLAKVPEGLADSLRFMGPLGDGVVPGVAFQMDWKAHPPREVWRKPVGIGWAGFSVAGRRAVTQEQREAEEMVTCYDIVTGNLLWTHQDEARFSDSRGDGPRSAPTLDPEQHRVFAMGATGILNCLDLETGSVIWTRNLFTKSGTKNLTWGKSSAPLLHGGQVIVTGGDTGPALLAFKRETGEPVWQGGVDKPSYSSPVIRTLAGREQIVCVNQVSVTGHDPATGGVLWTFPWPGVIAKVCQPIPAGPDRILVTASDGMKSHLLEIKEANGTLSCNAVWTSKYPRTKFSSAAVIGDFAYAMDDGTLGCVDLADGKRVWKDGAYGYGQHVIVGDHMIIQTESGDVVLVKPNPKGLEEVARLPALTSKTWNPPTLAGRWLLLRNDREAICFELAGP